MQAVKIITGMSQYKARAKLYWNFPCWGIWDVKVEQVFICSRRTSHCWVLCHPEVPVGALPWSGDHISCSCWSRGQSCPMTVHHLPAQLHLSIWTGCCWLLCHHLLFGTPLFSVKRRLGILQGKPGSWSRNPTWQKANGKMSGLCELLRTVPSPHNAALKLNTSL